jgi:hypothetical protein
MKHPILALVLASAPFIVLAAPAAPTTAEANRRVQDLPVVIIRARRIDPVSTAETGHAEDKPSPTYGGADASAPTPLGHLEQELIATRIRLARAQLELARLRRNLRATLRHPDPRQCEMAAASAPSHVP